MMPGGRSHATSRFPVSVTGGTDGTFLLSRPNARTGALANTPGTVTLLGANSLDACEAHGSAFGAGVGWRDGSSTTGVGRTTGESCDGRKNHRAAKRATMSATANRTYLRTGDDSSAAR